MATFKKGDTVKVVNRQFREFLDTIKVSPIGVVDTVENGYIRLQGFLPLGIPASFLELVPQEVVNDFNTQAEVWEYLLTGGKVVFCSSYYYLDNGHLRCQGSSRLDLDPESNFNVPSVYSKFIEPTKWYENIPATGILCHTSQRVGGKESINIIMSYEQLSTYAFRTKKGGFRYARPVTLEEAEVLIYHADT